MKDEEKINNLEFVQHLKSKYETLNPSIDCFNEYLFEPKYTRTTPQLGYTDYNGSNYSWEKNGVDSEEIKEDFKETISLAKSISPQKSPTYLLCHFLYKNSHYFHNFSDEEEEKNSKQQ